MNCVLPTRTHEHRCKRRARRVWMIAQGFPQLCGDLLRMIVLEWMDVDLDPSPIFTTFTLRCAVYAYLCAPQNKTVRSWGPIRYWDTHEVTSFDSLFCGQYAFNERLSWDTSNAESMEFMFSDAFCFNQPVYFCFAKVRSTVSMFAGAKNFNQPITVKCAPHWRTARMMFAGASSLNAPVYCHAPNLKDVFQMFYGARSFRATVTLTRTQPVAVKSMELPTGTRICVGGVWDWTVRPTYEYRYFDPRFDYS